MSLNALDLCQHQDLNENVIFNSTNACESQSFVSRCFSLKTLETLRILTAPVCVCQEISKLRLVLVASFEFGFTNPSFDRVINPPYPTNLVN